MIDQRKPKIISRLYSTWVDFWFAPQDLLALGIFRFLFAGLLIIMYSLRQFALSEFMSVSGLVNPTTAAELLSEYYRPFVYWFPTTDLLVHGGHLVFLGVLFLLMLGLAARWMAIVALFLHIAFLQRNVSICYGADNVATFWLIGLALTDSGQRFSLNHLISRPPLALGWFRETLTTVGIRLIQIQVCIIYAFTGMEKLKGPAWWSGTALWDALGNQQLALMDFTFLSSVPVLIGLASHLTVVFEIYFAALVWFQKTRPFVLWFGCVLHVGIALTLGLFFFSGEMIFTYILFTNISEKSAILKFLPARLLGRSV